MTRTIDGAGGTIEVGGHALVVPAGAVDGPVEFTMSSLPARMLKVRIQAQGQHSFTFRSPATLTLSYGRCGAPDPGSLRLYKIEPGSDEVLEDLGGTVDSAARTVTYDSLGTLSVYTLGVA